MTILHLSIPGTFQPGDPAPAGYLDWHEWARAQERAGLRQQRCRACKRWRYPQELRAGTCGGCS